MRVLSFDVGTRSLAYCVCSCSQEGGSEFQVEQWATVDLLAEGGPASMHVVSERMVDFLTGFLPGVQVDVVLIENQRGGKFGNATMVTVSHVMQAFYYTRAKFTAGPHPRVEFYSPTLKVGAAKRLLPDDDDAADTAAAASDVVPAAPAAAASSLASAEQKKNAKNYKKNKDVCRAACVVLLPRVASLTLQQAYAACAKKQQEDRADSLLQAYSFCCPPPPPQPKPRAKRARTSK